MIIKKIYYLKKEVLNGKQEDSCTRVAWVELTEGLTVLTKMFSRLRGFNILASHYNIKFKKVLTDNGLEFEKNKVKHPFERRSITIYLLL
ncbi:hypothetical protein [Tenacibaculum sediminilitoris]|uniref:hypothetical protein n=1 Tax=Tenacibaculum sediminilitoris TaxID=1820334 RepID=UPI0038B65CFD